MTLLFADGFEDGTTAWTLTNAALGTGRFGNGLVMSGGNGAGEVGFTGTAGPIIAGFAFKPAGAGVFAGFQRFTLSPHVGLTRGTGGEIIAFR